MKRAGHRVELALHFVDRLAVLGPLLAELAKYLQHLVAGLLDHEVVERLANNTEKRKQGERRTNDHVLFHCFVDEIGVGLVDERTEGFVGYEQQHVVDRGPSVG